MRVLTASHDTEIAVEIEPAEDGWTVRLPSGAVFVIADPILDEGRVEVTAAMPGSDADGSAERRIAAAYVRTASGLQISWKGRVYRFDAPVRPGVGPGPGPGSGAVVSPTSGVVADVLVEEGESVEAGQTLAVVEAMKVMTAIEASRSGVVSRILVKRGERIEEGSEVAQVDSPDTAGAEA